ncbi:hypothetical protein [Zoogloea sp.]|uniref:hypothetical protein n=1 Tax=Zoogloea sp. TaxID=49181 RepID=UPI0035B4CDC3
MKRNIFLMSWLAVTVVVAGIAYCFGARSFLASSPDLVEKSVNVWNAVGSWVSGLGSIAAAIAALHIAYRQEARRDRERFEADIDERQRYVGLALSLVNQIRGRVFFLSQDQYEHSNTLASLSVHGRKIGEDFSKLFGREVYSALPRSVLNEIESFSVAIFKLEERAENAKNMVREGKDIYISSCHFGGVDLQVLLSDLDQLHNKIECLVVDQTSSEVGSSNIVSRNPL